MRIWLNGQERELPDGANVGDVIAIMAAPLDGRGIAVAVDGEVVPRADWEHTELGTGQRVEVVQAVQGG